MYSLYLFKLLDNKWFMAINLINLEELPLSEIQTDYEIAYEFIHNYPIVSIKKIEENVVDGHIINAYVKNYMKQYGINNVRGGCYSDDVLDDSVIALLNKEINYTINEAIEDMNILYDIKNEHGRSVELENEIRNILLKVVEIKKQINSYIESDNIKLENEYNVYTKLKEYLNNLQRMKPTIFDDINWLRDNIENLNNINKQAKENYLHIVNKELPVVTNIFKNIVDDPDEHRIDGIKYKPFINLYSPSVLLDNIFISKQCYRDIREEGIKLINFFEYMAYVIYNRTAELEYDLNIYPKNYKQKYIMTKKFIKAIEKKID